VSNVPHARWYADRIEQIHRFMGHLSAADIKARQYRHAKYKEANLNEYIPDLTAEDGSAWSGSGNGGIYAFQISLTCSSNSWSATFNCQLTSPFLQPCCGGSTNPLTLNSCSPFSLSGTLDPASSCLGCTPTVTITE
jgi:hypothetical protein